MANLAAGWGITRSRGGSKVGVQGLQPADRWLQGRGDSGPDAECAQQGEPRDRGQRHRPKCTRAILGTSVRQRTDGAITEHDHPRPRGWCVAGANSLPPRLGHRLGQRCPARERAVEGTVPASGLAASSAPRVQSPTPPSGDAAPPPRRRRSSSQRQRGRRVRAPATREERARARACRPRRAARDSRRTGERRGTPRRRARSAHTPRPRRLPFADTRRSSASGGPATEGRARPDRVRGSGARRDSPVRSPRQSEGSPAPRSRPGTRPPPPEEAPHASATVLG